MQEQKVDPFSIEFGGMFHSAYIDLPGTHNLQLYLL